MSWSKCVRKWIALGMICVILCCAAVSCAEGVFEAQATVAFGQSDARAMLALINDFRTGSDAWYWNEDNTEKIYQTNLQPLAYDYALEQSAMQRAAEIALYYSHTRPDGTGCFTVDDLSYGENIAAGYRTYAAVFEGWQETEDDYSGQGHRRNMLNSGFTTIGIGHSCADGVNFWVQEFGFSNSGAGATAAVDTEKEMTLMIDDGILSGKTITDSLPSTLNLEFGGSAELPMLEAEISRDDYWSRIYNIRVKPAWTSSDEDAVPVNGTTAAGLAVGKTVLNASLWDYSGSVTVNVTYSARTADFVLPRELTRIDASAFDGITASAVDVPAGVTQIASGAFSSCAELKQIRIRGTDTVIASGAIPSGQGIVIICPRGSKAETYAQNNNNKVVRTK